MINSEWAKKLGLELQIMIFFDVFAIKHYFFAYCIATKLHDLIVSLFLHVLRVEQVLLANWLQFFQLLDQFVGEVGSQTRVNFILKKYVGMVAIVELKKGMISTYIFRVIVCQFSHEQNAYPVVLFSIDKNTQIILYYAILFFG